MSVSTSFNLKAFPALSPVMRQGRRRPPPFSIRFSEAERARLDAEASGIPLGTYIKAKVLGDAPIRLRRSGASVVDRPALAQALALLGRSHLASNLNQLAYAANIGILPMTPHLEAELRDAVHYIRFLRSLLLTALGLKEETMP